MLSGHDGGVGGGLTRRGGHNDDGHVGKEAGGFQHYMLEFAPAPFAYSGRVAAFLLPFLLPVLSFAGPHAAPLLFAGLIGVYAMDYLNVRGGALVAVWGTACAVAFCAYFHNGSLVFDSVGSIMVFMMSAVSLTLYAALASLQFTWLQTAAPELVLFFERIVLTLTPCIVAPLSFSAIIPHSTPGHVPLYLALVCAALHYFFAGPMKSSFKHPLAPSAAFEALAVSRLDAIVLTAFLVAVPAVAGFALQHAVMAAKPRLLLDALTASALVLLSILIRPASGLWFLSRSTAILRSQASASGGLGEGVVPGLGVDASTLEWVRRVSLIGGGAACAVGLQYRLVFGSYSYLFSGVDAPWNFVLVGVGIAAGCASLALMAQVLAAPVRPPGAAEGRPHFRHAASVERVPFGIVHSFRRRAISPFVASSLLFSLMVSVVSLGVASGTSPYFMLWVVVGGAHLCGYIADTDPSTWPPLLLSVAFVVVVVSVAFFGIIAESLPILTGAMHVSSDFVGWLYTVFALLATHLLHMCIFTTPTPEDQPAAYSQRAMGAGFIIMSTCFAALEHITYTSADVDVYPPLFVFLTSGIGMYTSYRLLTNCKISLVACATAMGVHGGKTLMFLAAEVAASEAESVEGVYAVFLGVSVLAFGLTAAASVALASMLAIEASLGLRRADPQRILLIFLAVSGVAVVAARRTLVAEVVEIATGTVGLGTDADPISQTTMLGACMIAWGLIVGAVVWPLFPRQKAFMRMSAGLVAVGVAMGALRSFVSGVLPEVESHAQRGLLVTSPVVAAVLVAGGLVLLGLVATKVIPLPRREVRFLLWVGLAAVLAFGFAGTFLPVHAFYVVWVLMLYFLTLALTLDFACLQLGRPGQTTPPARVARDIGIATVALNLVVVVLVITDISVSSSLVQDMASFMVDELHDISVSAVLSTGAAASVIACVMIRLRIARAEEDTSTPGRGGATRQTARAAKRALSPGAANDLSLIVNLLMVSGMLQVNLLNFVALDASIPLIVASSGLVLLFHDPSDDTPGLLYVFMLVYIDAALFARTVPSFYAASSSHHLVGDLFVALLSVPSHALVLSRWLKEDNAPLRSRPKGDMLLTATFLVLGFATMVWTTLETVRWFAAVEPEIASIFSLFFLYTAGVLALLASVMVQAVPACLPATLL